MARKATPAPKVRFVGPGALVAAIIAVPFIVLYLIFGSLFSLACLATSLVPLALYVSNRVHALALLMAARRRWGGTRVRGVLVYSDSPNWKDYIEKNWIPELRDRVVVLNWSKRKCWPRSLPVRLFNFFCLENWFVVLGPGTNFNPALILLRGLRHPHVYRYYYAFRDAKHGNMEALRKLETHMFAQFEGA